MDEKNLRIFIAEYLLISDNKYFTKIISKINAVINFINKQDKQDAGKI
jgi:hypothetical protein